MRNHAKALSSAALLLLLAAPVAAGDLTPSAAPASTMVTLNDLDAAIGDATDARIPIDSLPGSGTSVHVVSAAGSYYLRGDVVGQPGKNGIEIGADNVQIDLNGFALVGGAGAQRGVVISAFGNLRGLVVRDGSIRGWPLGGIAAASLGSFAGARLEDLTVSDCAGGGVGAVTDSTLARVVADGCGGFGINANNSAHVDCVARSNSGDGFLGFGAMERCVSVNNSGDGFRIGGPGLLTGCVANFNGGDGFELGGGATLLDSKATQNGASGVFLNGSENEATRCSVQFNGVLPASHSGIRVGGVRNVVDGNSVVSNNVPGVVVTGTENLIVRNRARNNAGGNFSVVAGNRDAQLLSPGSGFASTDPLANLSF